MPNAALILAFCIGLGFLAGEESHAADLSVDLNSGYRQMYDLDFTHAHETFKNWERLHPSDPLGPASNAAAYLFSEFDRLNLLESELFVDDRKFEKRSKLSPNPEVKTAFDGELARVDDLAGRILANSPKDCNALFSQILANGLRGDYVALVEKRNLASLSYMKSSRMLAERLLAVDPSYYDAYMAVGLENYLLSLNPAPVRWILRLSGAETDKTGGVSKLQLTAEKGHYLAPFARLLLAVAALRDKNRSAARGLLEGLAHEFPHNLLYRKELARIQP